MLQDKLVAAAVALLKPGGVMVYSTCTVNPQENERAVAAALANNPCLQLVALPAHAALGGPGLQGHGLAVDLCSLVQRFTPVVACNADGTGEFVGATNGEGRGHGNQVDSIGFFVAKFVKLRSIATP